MNNVGLPTDSELSNISFLDMKKIKQRRYCIGIRLSLFMFVILIYL